MFKKSSLILSFCLILLLTPFAAFSKTYRYKTQKRVTHVREVIKVRKIKYSTKHNYSQYGKHYRVLKSGKNYVQKGVASWYGPGFHRRRTSNGERYNMYHMTAAHKTLPFSTHVQVTNLSNGRKVIVRVNDRGPFVSNRIIDLSYAAARKLNMVGRGTVRVSVQAIKL